MAKANAAGRTSNMRNFFMVQHSFLDEPAWLALPMGARVLYFAVRRRYNGSNNGDFFLSVRTAADEIGCDPKSARRWFDELIEKGFIKVAKGGALGSDGEGIARYWILTEIGYRGQRPTKDFRQWKKQKPVGKNPTPRGQDGYASEESGGRKGTECGQDGYSLAPNDPEPCGQDGYISISSHLGEDIDASPSPSKTPSNHVGDFAESVSEPGARPQYSAAPKARADALLQSWDQPEIKKKNGHSVLAMNKAEGF